MFILKPDGSLSPMKSEPYDSEQLLQSWIADHPELLAGEQIQPDDPRRWLLVKREAGVPDAVAAGSRWSVDHLFLDQDGIPTFVEVKRSSDTRIRREIVGQMLDYAANGVSYWPVDSIRQMFLDRCSTDGLEADFEIRKCLGDSIDTEALWDSVKSNLEEGIVRLLFVADKIPKELLSVVEFLNRQMDRTQVLAIEVPKYTETTGSGLVSLLPRVFGQTIESQQKKKPSAYIASRQREYMRFKDARNVVRSLKLGSESGWRKYCTSGDKPDNIPQKPERTYEEEGWAGWGDWLGTGRIADQQKVYREFDLARDFVRTLGLKSEAKWRDYCKSDDKPDDIPQKPERTYEEEGWTGWGDWLGTGRAADQRKVYREFGLARDFVRDLHLKSTKDWRDYCKSGVKPGDIPQKPERTYEDGGWNGMPDWLGYTATRANYSQS